MNIAEILKYCPKGTKLYSPVFGEVIFDKIDTNDKYCITVYRLDGIKSSFTEEGYYLVEYPNSECVLFPSKNQRDWDEFRLPVKRGDIMMEVNGKYTFIANGKFEEHNWPIYICGINDRGTFITNDKEESFGWTTNFYIPASEEAKKELFDKIVEAGYRWNADTLELEKIEPKFKEGDVIRSEGGTLYLISNKDTNIADIAAALYKDGDFITYNTFSIELKDLILATEKERNKFHSALVREGYKYDKKQRKLVKQEVKPYDKVLVRDNNEQAWKAAFFSHYNLKNPNYQYITTLSEYKMCIPYEGNEYLLGTTDSPT